MYMNHPANLKARNPAPHCTTGIAGAIVLLFSLVHHPESNMNSHFKMACTPTPKITKFKDTKHTLSSG